MIAAALLSLACGLGLSLAFPRAGLAPFAWICPVPWLAILVLSRPRRALLLGFVFGVGFFGLLLNWIHTVLAHYTSLPLVLTLPIWMLLVGYLALYPACFGLLVSALARRLGLGALVLAPVLWVGLEFLRGRLLGGFPWGSVGYARAGGLALLQAASVGGVFLVSLLIAGVWSALAFAALIAWQGRSREARRRTDRGRPSGRPGILRAPPIVREASGHRMGGEPATGARGERTARRIPVLGALLAGATILAVGAVAALGASRLRAHPPPPPSDLLAGDRGDGGAFGVALVQGGHGSDLSYEEASQALRDYVDLSRRAARFSPRLIVWPESNAPFQPEQSRDYLDVLRTLSRETGARLLLGAVAGDEERGLKNSAYLIGPEGIEGRYDKIRLVQYGEYVPLKSLFPFIKKFVPEAGEFLPGKAVGILSVGPRTVGVSICYEIIFSEEILRQARAGADLLANLTNDSWYSRGGPWQHADFAVLRAIETGLWTARCASTGRTFLVDPLGRVVADEPMGGQALLLASLPRPSAASASGRTLFVRWGEWTGKGCVTISVIVLAFLSAGLRIDTMRSERESPPATESLEP